MQAYHSDAYYLAQLLERLEHLEDKLSKKVGPQANLTSRCKRLLQELHLLLTQEDSQAQDLLEYSLLPQINHLLLDARQELKLQQPLVRVGQNLNKAQKREKLIQERLNGPSTSAARGDLQILGVPKMAMPIRDEERKALIEDALSKLKMLLSPP